MRFLYGFSDKTLFKSPFGGFRGLLLLLIISVSVNAERVDMLKAGANPSGIKLNTILINKTIDKLNANGGGTLFFPAGKYLTGAIKLKSNITIEVEAGATLLFSDNFDDYLPFVEMRHEGILMKSFSPLIYAVDAVNITIKGEGTIDGQGKKWWDEFFRVIVDLDKNGVRDINKYQPMWDKANDVKALYAETNEDYVSSMQRRFFRPPFIQPVRCKNVRIEGIKIINSPFWTVNPEFCENVTVDGITIENPLSPNTDGINPESCRYVHISNCHISVGDDCITLKSGRDLQGRKLNAPDEDITITNCTMLAGHGGVVIGSEMSGGVKKVVISNCVFDGTDRGIRIKSTRGRGGVVEDIQVDNIVMRNIKEEAIVLDLKYTKMPEEPLSDRTPIFRNININNVTATDVLIPIRINGLEESPVTNITLTNVNILNCKQKPGFTNCKNIKLTDVYVNGEKISIQ
ncbi:MAG: glycoside hydrolase family 28 protein [Paludibacter sp.]